MVRNPRLEDNTAYGKMDKQSLTKPFKVVRSRSFFHWT